MAESRQNGETDKFQRYLAMLEMIPRAPQHTTTPELADRLRSRGFEVTLRTVQRDLERLSSQFGLFCDETVRLKKWAWLKTADVLDIPRLSLHAALTFKLVEQHLAATLPPATLAFLQPYFDAAGRALTQDSAISFADWANRVRIIDRGPVLLAPAVADQIHDLVYLALLENRTLQLEYLRLGGTDVRAYTVHPQALAVRQGVIYLVCVFDGHDNLRQLALHRIQSAKLGDKTAQRRADFDMDQYIAQGEFGTRKGQMIPLHCRFRARNGEHLRETPLSADQTIEDDGEDYFILRATVPWTAELNRWLLGWGPTMQVLGPPALREEIEARIREMYAQLGAC